MKSTLTLTFVCSVFALLLLSMPSCKKEETSTNNTNTTTAAAVADFTISGNNSYTFNTVTFTNNSSNAATYSWDFGDGGTSTLKDPTHSYTTSGTFTVTLRALNSAGTASVITKTVVVIARPTSLKIVKVTVTNMPFIDGNGAGWDSFNGPDVFYQLTNNAGTVFSSGNKYNDVVSASLPLSWTYSTPYLITDLNIQYNIQLYDYDTPDPDDYIGGAGFLFSNLNSVVTYPTTVTSNYNGVYVSMQVQWQ